VDFLRSSVIYTRASYVPLMNLFTIFVFSYFKTKKVYFKKRQNVFNKLKIDLYLGTIFFQIIALFGTNEKKIYWVLLINVIDIYSEL
jgi:hypothetical protein